MEKLEKLLKDLKNMEKTLIKLSNDKELNLDEFEKSIQNLEELDIEGGLLDIANKIQIGPDEDKS